MNAILNGLFVGVDDQIKIELSRRLIAECDHLAELPGGVDMEDRKRNTTGMEGFSAQVQENTGVLADRIHQHRSREG